MCRIEVSWLDAILLKGAASKYDIMGDFAPQVFDIHVYHVYMCVCFFYNTKKLKTISISHQKPKKKTHHPMHSKPIFNYSTCFILTCTASSFSTSCNSTQPQLTHCFRMSKSDTQQFN